MVSHVLENRLLSVFEYLRQDDLWVVLFIRLRFCVARAPTFLTTEVSGAERLVEDLEFSPLDGCRNRPRAA
jgi:hypothetical protein